MKTSPATSSRAPDGTPALTDRLRRGKESD
jgi:hypothetical protein